MPSNNEIIPYEIPLSAKEAKKLGWDEVDFVYVTGDAFVDHPSFGSAIIARVLIDAGYKVAIISQPDWNDPESVCEFGKPKLGFLVSAGNIDSMVNHYTVNKRKRSDDAYTPGNISGKRPDRATIVYSQLIRRAFKDAPIIIGGIEASLRRLAHYDYWSDRVRRSILMDSGADAISYGMGERSIVEIANALKAGKLHEKLPEIDGVVYKAKTIDHLNDFVKLPAWAELSDNNEGVGSKNPSKKAKEAFAESFAEQYRNSDPFSAKTLVEQYDNHTFIVQNPPAKPLTTEELDRVYALPYTRHPHSSYEGKGEIKAFDEIQFSLNSNRGCFGECAFCALTYHQGRIVTSRSVDSMVDEAKHLIEDCDFKGYIHDVGGPTANFEEPACKKQMTSGACTNKRCLSPVPCSKLEVDHTKYLEMLRRLRELRGVQKVFVRSGIRFDYAMFDQDHTFIKELAQNHTSGQLRLAPEHVSQNVLNTMGKPPIELYEQFCEEFDTYSKQAGLDQYVLPYFMSSHPGSKLSDAIELAEYIRDIGFIPRQVQDFYPTPSTLATAMFYTGINPLTGENVYIPKDPHEKAMQRALIQYKDPKNYDLVYEALVKANRKDLIGFDEKSLIRPRKSKRRRKPKKINK